MCKRGRTSLDEIAKQDRPDFLAVLTVDVIQRARVQAALPDTQTGQACFIRFLPDSLCAVDLNLDVSKERVVVVP